MGRKADAFHCMGELWLHNAHRYSIALTDCSITLPHNLYGNDMEHQLFNVP